MQYRRLLAALAGLVLLAPAAQAADPTPEAQVAQACPSNRAPALALPHVKEALAANREITIVALGSSSTQGWHSSDIAHSYPALLQAALNAGLPVAHVAVLNRGIGGQDVTEMLPRLESDALSVHPSLVIWQVGANGAMKRMHPDLFKRLLAAGVRRLHDGKTDVVLMDNQRAPAILASPDRVPIDQAMAEVALSLGAGLFSRGALMDQWRTSGFPYDRFVSDDGVHHNDYGYRCVAGALAGAILDGLKPAEPSNAVAKR